MTDSRLRSVLKALSWRIIASTATGIIAFIATNKLEIAVTIGGAEFLVKIVLYYVHERAWQVAR